MNRSARYAITVSIAFAAAGLPGVNVVSASETLSAEEIAQAVSDHSYQGSMLEPNSGFNEYYAPDGTIHGVDYKGEWTTRQGEMCFAYGQEPTCYAVSIDGPSMVLRQDGVIKGNGMLIQGNTVK